MIALTPARHRGVRPRGERQHRERHQSAHEVVARRSPVVRLDEGVVDDVDGDHSDRDQEQELLSFGQRDKAAPLE